MHTKYKRLHVDNIADFIWHYDDDDDDDTLQAVIMNLYIIL